MEGHKPSANINNIFEMIAFDKKYIGIIFAIMAILKSFGLVELSNKTVVSFSLAGLLFSISSLMTNIKAERLLYFLGLFSIIVLPFTSEALFKYLGTDADSYTLWGIAFVFMSLSSSDSERIEVYLRNKSEKIINQLNDINNKNTEKVISEIYQICEKLSQLESSQDNSNKNKNK